MSGGSNKWKRQIISFQTLITAIGNDRSASSFNLMAKTRLQKGLRATFIGLSVNAALAASKLMAGIFGHSHALVADAVESLADILSSIVVWRGLVVAEAPADADHPYGHGKAEPLAAAVVATLLIITAIGIAVQAVREVFQPKEGPAAFTLVVLLGVVAVKEGLF